MITAQHISRQYGHTKAVDDISFEVGEGENLVLLGTSGSGKTTTLKIINRLIEPTSGIITVNGVDISHQSPEILRRNIGYVLQHNSLFPHYTVAENIAVVPRLLGWDKKKISERTEALLDKMRLPASCLSAYPHELSGGQQQRVNIARAIAANPPVLLMDEPFGALDIITRATITREFCELDEFIHKTIIMVTHDVQEAFQLADRICLMSGGKIMQIGKPAELLFRPANDFVKEFLAASYLRLAMGTVKANDIWSDLEDSGGAEVSIAISASESLWNIIERTIKENMQTLRISNNAGQVKTVNKEGIFKAFSAYKYS